MKPGVSVIIPCYNSENVLPITISYLAHQRVPSHIEWEIIVVNNRSTDNTAWIAKNTWNSFGINIPFRIVDQPIPGLSSARRKVVEEAKYEFILFCDDDNWLNENYVRTCYEIMSGNSTIGVLGGLGEAVADGGLPSWFDHRIKGFGQGKQNGKSGDITDLKGYVYGAGFVIRRTAWDKIHENGFTQFLPDRKGNKLTSGGDVEICFAIRIAGYKIWYDERLKFKHYIPKYRLQWKYFLKLKKVMHISVPIISAYEYIYSENCDTYTSPPKWHWIRMSVEKLGYLIKYWIIFIITVLKSLQKRKPSPSYYVANCELIGWLRIRLQYMHICETLYSFKKNISEC